MKRLTYISLLMSVIFAVGCKDDPPQPEPETTNSVIIANKGIFPNGRGTISEYDPNGKSIENYVFQKANIRYPGSSVNSVYVDGNRTFIVVNGDGTLYVVNTDSYKVEAKFSGLVSPRYVLKVGPDKYYISDWGINAVHVLNMKARKITKQISTGVGPENMLIHDDKVFITNSGGIVDGAQRYDSTVTVLHALTDTLMATIFVGENPNSLQIDKDDRIWVCSPGIVNTSNPFLSTMGDFRVINPDSLEVVDTLEYNDNYFKPSHLQIDKNGEVLYFLSASEGADIMKYEIGNPSLPVSPFIEGSFNSIAVDEINSEIYASDPLTEDVPGDIYRFDRDGVLQDKFKADIIPVNFAFK